MAVYLFVYGSLMSGLRNHHLLEPFLLRTLPARADGVQLYPVHPDWPGAVAGPGAVMGELAELDSARLTEAFAVLDELEDYYGPGDPRNLYVRLETEVRSLGGELFRAWIYLWAQPTDGLEPIPGGDWRSVSPEG